MTTLDEKALKAAKAVEGMPTEYVIRAYLDALPPATPDYIYDPDDWECTYEYSDRSELVEHLELSPGDVRPLLTLVHGPHVFVSDVILSRDDDGDPDETEVQFFASEDEARAASVPRPQP